MREISTILDNGFSCLLIAPTGWGKTTLLLDLVESSTKKWVYLSPLRALCDEFSQRAKFIDKSFCPRSKKELEKVDSFKLLSITPELCSDKLIFDEEIIWIFDEFHLFYYWGESFRRKIIDLYEVIIFFNRPSLLLSATINDEVLSYWEKSNLDKVCVNLGNQKIKKEPSKRFYYSNKLFENIPFIKGDNPTLIFVKYRSEVKLLEERLLKAGFNVVVGLGGESHLFNERIIKCPNVDFIVGTSALSHGVNLPKISNIIITYKISNLDMWTQMVGRGGRRGEEFRLYTKDTFRLTWLQIAQSLLNSYLEQIRLEFKRMYYEFRRYYNSQSRT